MHCYVCIFLCTNSIAVYHYSYALVRCKWLSRPLSSLSTQQELSSCWQRQQFRHNRQRPKSGVCCAPSVRELGRHLTQYRWPRPTSVPSGSLIHPAVLPQWTWQRGLWTHAALPVGGGGAVSLSVVGAGSWSNAIDVINVYKRFYTKMTKTRFNAFFYFQQVKSLKLLFLNPAILSTY